MDVGSYYDDFAPRYEARREFGYHKLIDDLEAELVADVVPSCGSVLEVGCGTGLVLDRIRQRAATIVGLDISAGMLSRARGRGFAVTRGDACALPFEASSFDVVCSFKVLAHVPAIEAALEEMTRVLRPGGHLVLDFYNPFSLRYLVKRIVGHRRTGTTVSEGDVTTRWDDPRRLGELLPSEVAIQSLHGVRVITPAAGVLDLPFVGSAFAWCEQRLLRWPRAAPFGGFVVAVAQKQ